MVLGLPARRAPREWFRLPTDPNDSVAPPAAAGQPVLAARALGVLGTDVTLASADIPVLTGRPEGPW